ncbi:Cthe_2314 family HEPN domain-containing protein [Oceanospirillum linum]|uniref:Cthe_2314 family HEPN domain-containing protein n=1 Tax=Oceanospirillum linum TaxID=966 RepID=UPI00089F5614|nr:Cthe_2314 family HEPN domain-containing protein [Oceanospirillum linum]SEG41672.1 hypothetical protein SAMN04489856_11065 [Oleiphilus messinensis]SMP33542.1 hypothetical protein SAMN06264348_11068 [Oceanospirillum linum]
MKPINYRGIEEVCRAHAERLRWARDTLSPLFPLQPENLSRLSPIDLAVFDQFVVRFSKLQDAMGAKLFPAVLELTKEQGELRTFIDKLHQLEKMGALDSAEQWLVFREMRNQFAHDYPTDPNMQSGLLNQAFDMTEILLKTLDQITDFAAPYLPK